MGGRKHRKKAREIRRQRRERRQKAPARKPEPFLLEGSDVRVLGYTRGGEATVKASDGDIRTFDDVIQKVFQEGTLPSHNREWKWYFGREVEDEAKRLYFNNDAPWVLESLKKPSSKRGGYSTPANPSPEIVLLYDPKERSYIIGETTFTQPATKCGKREYRVWDALIASERRPAEQDEVEWSGVTLANDGHNKFSYLVPGQALHISDDRTEVKAQGLEDIISYISVKPGAQDILIALQEKQFQEYGIEPSKEDRLQYTRDGRVIDLRSRELASRGSKKNLQRPWRYQRGIPLKEARR